MNQGMKLRRRLLMQMAIGVSLAVSAAGFSAAPSTAVSESDVASAVKIGFAQGAFGNGWYEVNAKGVEEEAATYGWTTTVVSGNNDPAVQNPQVQSFITQQMDAVILNPTDRQAVTTSIEGLVGAGIPTVLVNASVVPDLLELTYCHVGEDEVLNSSMVGAEMARTMLEKYGTDATIKSVMILGFPGDSNSLLREEGFLKGYNSVEGAPKLDRQENLYGHWNADSALAPMQAFATGNPDLKAIFVGTDSMLPGVQKALETTGMWNDVSIAAYDGRMSVVKQIMDNPNGPVIATVANLPYEQGVNAVAMVKKALDGVPKEEACPGNNFVVPPTLVTAENAASYYKADADY